MTMEARVHENPVKKVRTCCQACHCECGVIVHVVNNKVVKIEGDPGHPMNRGILCPKGLAYTQLLYHADRLKYPLKRVGEKGEGRWQRISWDEALNLIVSKFNEVKEKYGPEAIAAACGTGPRDFTMSTMMITSALGSPNFTSITHVCYVPSVMAESMTVGDFVTHELGPDYRNSKCVLVWGANPLVSHPPRGAEILEAKSKGAKLVVVDPRFTALASKADLWLQVRPATDDALALGMLNVIINQGLYDKDFVDKWCVGFEKLRKRVQEYPPERVAEITWVPAEKIRQAARIYATTKPAVLHHRVAVEHNVNAFQINRALIILIAITGNLDVKGGNLFRMIPPGFKTKLMLMAKGFRLPEETEEKRIGAKEFPLFSGLDSPWPTAHKPKLMKAILTGKPYPIRALYACSNLILNSENSKEAWEALKKLDFLVVADFFMTPTAELADIVLPAATWLEKEEICDTSYTNYIAARQKAIEPLYECWDDKKIAFEIVKRLGLEKRFPFSSVEEFNDYRLNEMGITFEDLKKQACIIVPLKYKKYETKGFKTPSGKVELYSSTLERFGYDPLPYAKEPPQSPISTPQLAKEYPLILISGGRHIAYFHSENRQIPWLRETYPEPVLEIHPETAKELGVSDGDWVRVETPKVKDHISLKAQTTEAIHPKVVHIPHGWWFPETTGPEHDCFKSNVNVIIPSDHPYDPVCGATQLRGLLCRVRKVEEGSQTND